MKKSRCNIILRLSCTVRRLIFVAEKAKNLVVHHQCQATGCIAGRVPKKEGYTNNYQGEMNMSKIRTHKKSNYTVMSNYHLQDQRLSFKAKGLLSVMLSLPKDWDYSINGIVKISKEEKTAVISTLNELKENGYVKVTKKMPNETESGRIEYEYDIYETPKQCTEEQKSEIQDTEEQGIENLGLEIQGIESDTQLNTKKQITKEQITKYIKDIVEYLNNVTHSHFKPTTKTTRKYITARLKEGYTVNDFKLVIDKKNKDWGNDEKFNQYLTPSTLFNPTNFEKYLNAAKKGDVNENNRTDAGQYGITVL